MFIHDSYACRKDKGVHAGVKWLQTFLRQVTRNGSRPAWYLQLDVHHYFMRIDKSILFSFLKRRIADETALWLTRLLVFHGCTQDYQLKGNPALVKAIPAHKTLFNASPDKGLPIGNLNSQFFANVYLNELDQFVKHRLKCRHYLRYCDDFVLLSYDRAQLLEWREKIELFLYERLALTLNKKQRLAPVSNGVDFLGYIVRRDYLLVRRRVVNHLKRSCVTMQRGWWKRKRMCVVTVSTRRYWMSCMLCFPPILATSGSPAPGVCDNPSGGNIHCCQIILNGMRTVGS